MILLLRRKLTLREPSSLCISPVYKSLKTKKTWKIGRAAQTESSFLYVFAPGLYASRILRGFFQTGLFSATVATFIALSYPNLQQDPNVTTQSILTQISQQLSNNGTIPSHAANPSIQTSFSPPTSVIFINSVWFLSLVLSLTCALLATLLQQWARRYLQIVQQKYAPLHHARIHEYFSRGAGKFGIFGFVEVLPLLLLVSVFLFFAGLVVFAFRGNHIVAYFTLAIVGFCTLSYITLTLLPFFFHDCPYQTPLTSVLWFSAQTVIPHFFSALYHCAEQLHLRWGAVSETLVKSLYKRHKNKASKYPSENIISKLESSTENISMDTNKKILARTLHWLHEDHELEEFAAGIPGLYESEAFTTYHGEVKCDIRTVLAALPRAANSQLTLSWSIIWLARRAIDRNLPKAIQQRRIKTCLRALYYIPGAIRDILASYAAGKHYCLEILPLLNSPESLEIIDELWDSPNDDVSLSVRCAAAVVAAFMITPPVCELEYFLPPNIRFIGDEDIGKQCLDRRLGVGTSKSQPWSDTVRLQNIVRFIEDIKDTLGFMTTQWWTADIANAIFQERRALFDVRHTEDYRIGRGTFDQHGNRASPEFVPAAQQDLITLTLEILARDSVTTAAREQREVFRQACHQLGHIVSEHTQQQARARTQAFSELMQAAATHQVVRRGLEPITQSLNAPVPGAAE
jgi:hypothetical protein